MRFGARGIHIPDIVLMKWVAVWSYLEVPTTYWLVVSGVLKPPTSLIACSHRPVMRQSGSLFRLTELLKLQISIAGGREAPGEISHREI